MLLIMVPAPSHMFVSACIRQSLTEAQSAHDELYIRALSELVSAAAAALSSAKAAMAAAHAAASSSAHLERSQAAADAAMQELLVRLCCASYVTSM